MNRKKVLMVMPHMMGGGAERVAAQIMNKLNERGYDTRFILTRARENEVVRSDLSQKTELILLSEEMCAESKGQKFAYFPERVYSSLFGRMYEQLDKYVPASVGKATIEWQYHREISWLRNYFLQNPDMTVIVFLQPAIPVVLLAARGLPNKIIVSERGNPNNLMKKRYGRRFMEKYYVKASAIVFQTTLAQNAFPNRIAEKGVVIKNPIKEGLPVLTDRRREKSISTFCRIHPDKDLMTLLRAFHAFNRSFPEYKLKIIGDAKTENEVECRQELLRYIHENGLENAVIFKPFTDTVHQDILYDSMYVNSSVTEGLCNAMLEAMAIGLPTVCTDCPIGGARDTIEDGINGLLVPVGDPHALCEAMKRVVEDPELALRLSENGRKIRKALELDKVVDRWCALL